MVLMILFFPQASQLSLICLSSQNTLLFPTMKFPIASLFTLFAVTSKVSAWYGQYTLSYSGSIFSDLSSPIP